MLVVNCFLLLDCFVDLFVASKLVDCWLIGWWMAVTLLVCWLTLAWLVAVDACLLGD